MNHDPATATAPLWLSMEEKLLELDGAALEGDGKERAVQRIARELDQAGYNVSRHGGNMLALRWAIDARAAAGRALLADFNEAVAALTLDDLEDTHVATITLTAEVGEAWPRIRDVERREDITRILDQKRLDLLIAAAREMAGDTGVRYLITEGVEQATILEALGITETKYAEITAAIAAEKAEVARVERLLEEVADKGPEDQARHLISHDVTDENIVKLAGIDQAAVDGARQAMEEELREKQRLAEEAAATRKAAAEGPALDAIPPEEMLEHIEAIREILEFSDKENEIRQMCEQSSIPKSLVDVVIADPDKLDELEKAAGG